MPGNPFTPTFGAPPPLLVGRGDLLDAYEDALDEGPGSPGYATVYTGARGIGKTVMLNAAEDLARQAGYAVIAETATDGLVNRLIDSHLPKLLPKKRRKVANVNVPTVIGVGLTDPAPDRTPHLRDLIEAITIDQPVLLTIDEIHAGSLDQLRQVVVVLQHAIRERRRFAICAAGLPSAVNEALNDNVLTFLRRADHHTLGAVDLHEVRTAFTSVINENGRAIDPDATDIITDATGGYPFMIQLVGYHTWKAAGTDTITLADARRGADAARRRVGRLVIQPALNDLSAVDRTFLLRMATDNGPSAMRDIAERMGVDSNYASQYRLRLIAAGLIAPAGHGRVDFALPGLRDWLRDHGAIDT